MSNLAIRMRFEELRSLAFGSIGAGYMGVGTAVSNPVRQFLVQNLTDATLLFSFDGTTDHFVLPATGFYLSDITANKTISSGFYLSEGDRLYVKESGTPTTGSVYFTVIYGSES